jgi:hypothetical protein
MEAVFWSEIKLFAYRTTRCHNPEISNPNNPNYAIFTTGVRRDIVMLVVSIG